MELLILCYLNPDLAKVKIVCCWNGDRTLHLFGTVYVRSARRVALFSVLGKMEVRKCGGRFMFLGVHSGSLCQTMHSTAWTSSQICHSFLGAKFYISRRWRFAGVDKFYKKDSGGFKGVHVLNCW